MAKSLVVVISTCLTVRYVTSAADNWAILSLSRYVVEPEHIITHWNDDPWCIMGNQVGISTPQASYLNGRARFAVIRIRRNLPAGQSRIGAEVEHSVKSPRMFNVRRRSKLF